MTERQKKMRPGWLFLGALIPAALALPLLWHQGLPWGRASELPASERGVVGRPLPVSVARLGTITPPRPTEEYRGTLVASKSSELAFRRAGRIARIAVREGDHVERAMVLAELDAGDVRAAIEANAAQQREAEASLAELIAGPRSQTIAAAAAEVDRLAARAKLAAVTAEREQRLYQANGSNLQARDEAIYGSREAEAALQAARQQLAELRAGTRSERIDAQRARLEALRAEGQRLREDLRDSRIEAPYSGVVARRRLDEGTVVTVSQPVLRILQVDPLEARFGVAAEDARRLRVGQQVGLSVAGRDFTAAVDRIAPELDAATRTQDVFVRIEPETLSAAVAHEIVPGRTVSLSITPAGAAADGYWMPLEGLSRSTRGLWSVFVLRQPDTSTDESPAEAGWVVERRDVQVLETTGTYARIEGTALENGLPVVIEALHRLVPGMRVEPRQTGLRESVAEAAGGDASPGGTRPGEER
jgi:RND family efflux transporter MFP subunit